MWRASIARVIEKKMMQRRGASKSCTEAFDVEARIEKRVRTSQFLAPMHQIMNERVKRKISEAGIPCIPFAVEELYRVAGAALQVVGYSLDAILKGGAVISIVPGKIKEAGVRDDPHLPGRTKTDVQDLFEFFVTLHQHASILIPSRYQIET